ncbi:insulinase family protein [Clostridium botulinum]|uniref:Peptidase, M16 family n=1 Tax=Clostridium botulinum D str. 1873 TaxID=592027 RepID=A0A9P2G6D2_CLOBO|nr:MULTISPECIES: insulinase family protein [Clostridium]AYF53311.1 peptidase M16 [Clostridium novyi]EES90785.1 peptidase, M16 family [Clostridium botulinum D str. 1873]MBO3441867.1 insulinase family protein [Clostridium haemolyticum]NFV46476.1 insulinase family protein [Clostridium botulinum]QPW55961.1 insulinase family protein [Clostridium botulinum]
MEFKLNNEYHGFKFIEEKEIKDINSKARIFYHEKSGAKLLNLQNEDDNKVFAIGFRTPPDDSTGVPHIMEHSVLCGSRKFPIKDPFVELAKGSLNTFLNAMTFSDKTIYPVASRNEKDFFNLMDVYLDAVFYPNIYKYPEILMQEGWHYELDNKDDEITYKGVVYNEMKGAFSSPEDILFRKIQETLFPDTTYGVESGGDPEVIPELTYEQFIDFHKKFYHPSNSYIYLYGDGDLDKELKFINDEYLSRFEKMSIDSHIDIQKPFGEIREVVSEYPVSQGDSGNDKSFFSLNFVLKDNSPETYLAFEILEYLLLETPAAPLKKALIQKGIGKDVYGYFDSGILQPVFSVVVKNANKDRKEEFKNIVFNTLKELVHKGIDKNLIEACINIKEFKLREMDTRNYPKGLIYYTKAMDSWLYDKDPCMYLEYENALQKVKTALTTNYFEELIESNLINVNHGSLLILNPKAGLAEENDEKLRNKLREYKLSLSEKEIDNLINQTKALKERQMSGEKKEDLEKIPLLSLEDINKKAEEFSLEEKLILENKVLFQPMFTNKIAYIKLVFDTTTVKEELVPYLGLLSGILGRIDTDKYSYGDLSNEINIYTGGISYAPVTFIQNNTNGDFVPKFIVKSKALVDKVPKLLEIIEEVLLRTNVEDKNRLKEIIQEMKSRLEMMIFDAGHIVAANRLFSYFSKVAKYEEYISGLEFYKFVEEIEENFDDKFEEIVDKLKQVQNLIFNRRNLIINVAIEEEYYNEIEASLNEFLQKLNNEKLQNYQYSFDFSKKNEGLLTQGNVQYVMKGYNYKELGYTYKGSMQVLKTIESLDYLWNNIRVLGGAYGAFASFGRSGNLFFGSYRDPNIKESLEVYDKAEEYLRNFDADDREMTKYIIGTISGLDTPLTPSLKSERTLSYYLSNITQEDIQKERDEVINCSKNDIRDFANMIKDCMNKNYICVLGNSIKIKENKELFNELVEIFK